MYATSDTRSTWRAADHPHRVVAVPAPFQYAPRVEFDSQFWVQSDEPDLQHQIHLLEAATATRFESGHQVEIQLGHYCNNRCVFCVSGQLTEDGLARPISDTPVLEALESSAANGIKKVTFLGGEPTIQRSFLPALERAVALGFEDIVIFTNGARGADRAWLDQIQSLGRFTWRFSLQGANEEAHEAATRRKRSWRRIVGAIAWLAEQGEDLTANMCLTRQALASLPEFPALLERYGVRQLHIDMVRPNNAGRRDDDELRAMMPRHSEARPHIEAMLAGFDRLDPDFDVSVGNYPYCMLPERAHRIQHGGEPTLTLTTGHRGELDRLLKKYDYQKVDAVYAAGCDACVFRPTCRGVPARYAELYGTGELTPLSADAVRARDADQGSFAVTAQAQLLPLLDRTGDAGPPGFTVEALTSDIRERRVELRLVDPAQRRVAVVFTPVVRPPSDLPAPVLLAPRMHVRVRDAAGVDKAALRGALAWLEDALADLDGVGEVAAAATPAARDRAIARIGALVRAVTAQRRYGAWLYTGRRAAPNAAGVVLRFAGPEDAAVDLTLSVGADGKLAAGFALGAGTSREAAGPVVAALRQALAAA